MPDAIVIGSGAGGAWVAKELAEGGVRVTVIEEGDRPRPFTGRPTDAMPDMYRDAGLTNTLGNVVIQVPTGRTLGGSTVINMATCFRPLDERLGSWGMDPAGLAPHMDAVESFLGVEETTVAAMGGNGTTVLAGLAAIGLDPHPTHRNASHDGPCGLCFIGCPDERKHDMLTTTLPAAEKAGATILTGTRAIKVLRRGRRAVGVLVEGAEGRYRLDADAVFVAAGALHTPVLLRHSGVRARGLGRHLHIQPATRVAAHFEHEIRPWEGVGQAVYAEVGDGIMLESTVTHPSVEAMVLPLQGKPLEDAVTGWRHVATCGIAIGDESEGRIHGRGRRPYPTYHLDDRDAGRLVRGVRLAAEGFLAAGATEVYLPVRASVPVKDQEALDHALRNVRAKDLILDAFHPTSTAGIGRVTDADGRVKGYEGLYVADASLLPTSLDGRNPQITIMALAHRIAHRYLETLA